jgi:hypothetical protein
LTDDEEPHPYGWGILPFKLRLTRVLLPLIPHIFADHGFVYSYCRYEKSSCPYAPVIPVYLVESCILRVPAFVASLPDYIMGSRAAPCSHPHPHGWGTPAGLDWLFIIMVHGVVYVKHL